MNNVPNIYSIYFACLMMAICQSLVFHAFSVGPWA